jgi:GT2 family glycosyltransferase
MSADPVLDVVILTWNDGAQAQQAVDSALASRGVDVHVVVVDNASHVPFAHADGDVTVVRSATNLGVAGGRNLGARAGRAPLVCFLDSDAVLHPDGLARLIAPFASDAVGLTCPVFDDQLPEQSAGRAPGLVRKAARAVGLTDRYATVGRRTGGAWEVDFGIGACQVVRREAFHRVGGLDDRDLFGPEDVDFCLRVQDAGWAVLQVAGASCIHPPRRAHRQLLSRRGLLHARAVLRYLVRRRRVAALRPR